METAGVFTNEFGEVTSKQVTYYRNKGWFRGGSREDVPIRHVTSVRLETSRKIVVAVLLILVGLLMLAGPGVVKLVGILTAALGVLALWGSPSVAVNTAGGDLSVSKGFPWQKDAADAFVRALRAQLFKED
ncbi:hypothetical protein BMS3Bbin01_00851 [bacterium BMS3Bbin01]|nr:hypothetical protein BMS3Bbin01_00851 [bacterium BMS3Bbin01]